MPRSVLRPYTLAAATGLILAVVLAAAWGRTRHEAEALVDFEQNGSLIQQSIPAADAIDKAEKTVGYDVRVPMSVPGGFTLRSVHAQVGPVGPDQNGVIRDEGYIKTVVLLYLSDSGGRLAIEQHAPERSIVPPANATRTDSGQQSTEASLIQREGVTHLIWDSADATYRLTLSGADEDLAQDSPDTLLAIAKSMR